MRKIIKNNLALTSIITIIIGFLAFYTDIFNNTYIDHIDCWGKYISPTKVLIREVPDNHPQYDMIEETKLYKYEGVRNSDSMI